MVSAAELDIPEKRNTHSLGTTASDSIGPFAKPHKDDPTRFRVKHADKTTLYASAIGLAGGASPPTDEDPPKPKDIVPFSYFSNDLKLYEEITHRYNIKGWYDCTCNDGLLMLHCLQKGMPYLGFAFSAEHQQALERYMAGRVFKDMQVPGNPLHEPRLLEDLGNTSTAPTPHRGPRARASRKPKANTRAGRRAGEHQP